MTDDKYKRMVRIWFDESTDSNSGYSKVYVQVFSAYLYENGKSADIGDYSSFAFDDVYLTLKAQCSNMDGTGRWYGEKVSAEMKSDKLTQAKLNLKLTEKWYEQYSYGGMVKAIEVLLQLAKVERVIFTRKRSTDCYNKKQLPYMYSRLDSILEEIRQNHTPKITEKEIA